MNDETHPAWSIDLRQVTFGHASDRSLIDRLDLSVGPLSRLSVVGPSGGGKTTLLRILAGLLKPNSGERVLAGRPPAIGFLAQDDPVLPWRTVSGNVDLLMPRGRSSPTVVASVLAAVGLPIETYADRYPEQLSGGQRRRLGLAMVLANQPDLLLLDEPGASLDETTRFGIADLILSSSRMAGSGLVVVTHDVEEALLFGDDLLIFGRSGAITRFQAGLPADRTSHARFEPEFQDVRADVFRHLRA